MTNLISPREAAMHLGTSTRTVQRWIATGRLPATRVGGRWRVAIDAIGAISDLRPAPPTTALIRTLFIANRGEIARRISRTCERLGIQAIVAPTQGADALDLLDRVAVVARALASGADAIHPGFGFLAENPDFAEDVIKAGLRWIGPPPEAIRLMGDKAAARRLARSLDIPVIAGYDGTGQSNRALARAAAEIGYPVMVKPSAGGGGKGMRIVRQPERLHDALDAGRREAASSFGDERLVLERLVEGARHVEVQVLFDRFGEGVHLGERDCSIQRRHQKILEEAPSPALDPTQRAWLGEAALRLAKAVGYESAGTCEFLVDPRGTITFSEMNTRLQVEHPVTEMITGRDLVADQIRIAAGEPLGIDQADASSATGHAVEVRLYAEDAEAGFLPATGRVATLRWPFGDGVRVDAGIDEGDPIGGRFDPMLAKIIAWGPDRRTALTRLADALDRTLVLGVVTNLRFLRWLVRQPVVREGEARIDTLERIWPPDDWTSRTAIPETAWSQAAQALLASREPDPWSDGWRLNAPATLRVRSEDEERPVAVPPPVGHDPVEQVVLGDGVHLDLAGRSVAFRIAPPPDIEEAARFATTHGSGPAGQASADVVAPMPGTVIRVHVVAGQAVGPADPVATIEAMKMEHAVAAPIGGRVIDLAVRPGAQVARGERLATIES
jgi:acetyl-CoA/propionyl-CoA carboxylase biotin carboxyl carrier protein